MFIQRYKTELSWVILSKLAVFPFSFFLTALIFRSLSVEDYAVYSFFVACFYQFSQFDFGIFAAIKTKIPRLLNSDKNNASNYLVSSFLTLLLTVPFVFLAIFVGYKIFGVENFEPKNFVYYFIFIGLVNNLFYFFLHTNAALGKSEFLSFNQILQTIIFLPFCVYAGFTKITDPNLFILFFVSAALCSNLIFSLLSYRSLRNLNFSLVSVKIVSILDIFVLSTPYFLNQLIAVAYVFGPKLVAFLFLNADDVAIQDLYTRLCSPLLALCAAASVPGWTRVAGSEETSHFYKQKIKSSQRNIVASLIACVLAICIAAPWIINIWVGDSAPELHFMERISFAFYFAATILYMNTAALANGMNRLKLQAQLGGTGVLVCILLLIGLEAKFDMDLTSLNIVSSIGLLVFGFWGRIQLFQRH